jgi:hypothetical protein
MILDPIPSSARILRALLRPRLIATSVFHRIEAPALSREALADVVRATPHPLNKDNASAPCSGEMTEWMTAGSTERLRLFGVLHPAGTRLASVSLFGSPDLIWKMPSTETDGWVLQEARPVTLLWPNRVLIRLPSTYPIDAPLDVFILAMPD